jgi:DNA-binding NarL/FixJ family response regulator
MSSKHRVASAAHGIVDPEVLAAIREAAAALASQSGRGIHRETLVGLARAGMTPLSVLAGPPVVAIVHNRAKGSDSAFAALTSRERQVAALLAAGRSNAQIAAELVLSLATVKDHVHRILTKTALSSRAAVAAAWHR